MTLRPFLTFAVLALACNASSPPSSDNSSSSDSASTTDASSSDGQSSSTTAATPVCGNGIVESGEDCDNGENSAECDLDCTLPACGDGHLNPEAGEQCDDSDLDSADGCSETCQAECLIFVTNGVHTGALGGLAGADQLCQDAADDANLHGTYKALLSDASTSAKDHAVTCDGPFIRRDGMPIAATPSILFDDAVNTNFPNPVSLDETGVNLMDTEEEKVWTGSEVDGGVANARCDDWKNTEVGEFGNIGQLDEVGNAWISDAMEDCTAELHLYCIQQKN